MQLNITKNNIKLRVNARDWREAVTHAGIVLAKNGFVEDIYVGAMIRTVEELGPYIVVAPGLALPHARRNEGVIKSGISIITLAEPVEFGNADNDPVYVVIGLAGIDDKVHLQILQTIATLFEDEGLVYRIASSNCKQDIIDCFNRIEVNN